MYVYIYRTIYAYMQIYLLRVVFGLFKNLKILKYFPFAFAACNQKYLKLYIVYVYICIYIGFTTTFYCFSIHVMLFIVSGAHLVNNFRVIFR